MRKLTLNTLPYFMLTNTPFTKELENEDENSERLNRIHGVSETVCFHKLFKSMVDFKMLVLGKILKQGKCFFSNSIETNN